MINLPNGCRRGEFKIFPPNWKSPKAKVSDIWYAQCRFIDPAHLDKYPKGKQIRIKCGINRLKKLDEKRFILKALIKDTEQFFEEGYNPITDSEFPAIVGITDNTIDPILGVLPTTQFIKAFHFALAKSDKVKESKADGGSVLKSITAAAATLGFATMSIGDIQVKHIKMLLDECHRANPRFSAKRFNKAKANLSGMFRVLVELGAASGNMALAISPMRETPSKPLMFTDDDIERIKKHLWDYNRPFYKFMMLFYYSGGRIKELFSLKGSDVDLLEQTYTTLVKKGKQRWVKRTIRNVALDLWKEQMQTCGLNDYVFSVDLLPGPKQINSKQVTRRWMLHVKKPLGIEATFYKLKHLNTDRTVEALSIKTAAGQNGHTSTKMVETVYAYNEQKRIHNALKELDIEL